MVLLNLEENIVKSITKKQLEEIAKEKMADLNAHDIEQAAKNYRWICKINGHRGKRIMKSKRYKNLIKDKNKLTFKIN